MSRDIAQGVAYLHSLRPPIVHRDLKSANILVGKNYQVKVSDFGIANVLEKDRKMSVVGTVPWTAPELLRGTPYTEKVDVYSFAIILWELLERKFPYEDLLYFDIIHRVTNQQMRPKIPPQCPNNFRSLMQECWMDDPNQRPAFDEIVFKFDSMEWGEWEVL